ncbi:DNA cytosine methyltransferase [Pseudomonas monteilii]|uniref:DNA cytosine methyltransferase n=1 Tax=Pseudomonas monteilii TaxID=76759 RepID=UPI001E644A5F|nr:DNA cytosine methyltransferase [Pseudomonas monteilii]
MTTIINAKIGESKGVSRVFMEGRHLLTAGIQIGKKYSIKSDKIARRLELIEVPTGFAGKCISVSKRERNGVVHPVIDLRSEKIREVFEDDHKVRVAIRRGRIVITALQIQTKIRERLKRMKEKLERGQKLAVASLFHGGVLDRALHSGMVKSGVGSFVQVGVEMESDYLDCSIRNNGDIWTEDSIAIHSDVRDVYLSENTPLCEILVGGIPCVGASKSGRSKNKLAFAESHNDAGALFVEYLNWLRHVNPCIAIIENVGEYANTASMSVIRSVFTHLGYVVHEAVLDGWDFGTLEHRKRLVVVAITPGIGDSFSFDNLKVNKVRESCINAIIDQVPLNDGSWKEYSYLAEKEVRDLAAGKGFARQLLTGEEDGCGTLGCQSPEYRAVPGAPRGSKAQQAFQHGRAREAERNSSWINRWCF